MGCGESEQAGGYSLEVKKRVVTELFMLEFEGHGDRILEYAHVSGENRGLGFSAILPHRRPICMLNRPVSRGASGEYKQLFSYQDLVIQHFDLGMARYIQALVWQSNTAQKFQNASRSHSAKLVKSRPSRSWSKA